MAVKERFGEMDDDEKRKKSELLWHCHLCIKILKENWHSHTSSPANVANCAA